MTKNDRRSPDVTAVADGQAIRTGLRHLAAQWKRILGQQLGNQVVLGLLIAGGEAEEQKERNQNMNNKEIMNLLNVKKAMNMNGKKKTKVKVLVRVQNKSSMKRIIEPNAKLKMKTTLNSKLP
jgi:hypothetical protein